jgi:tetratricopeptide (TPR) repeat protein
VDARHQYLAVAEHYLREGQPQRALDIYQKVADLDPENTSIQIKLAEAYLREGQAEQAYEAFVAAAGEMRRQRKEEEALEVYLRALAANPRGQLALSSVINLYIQRNDIPNAVALIERLLQERPSDAELLILLSRVHQTRHDLEKAEAAIARALSSDPARYQYALDLAALFLQRGDLEGALRQYDRVAGLLAEYHEDEKGVLLLREVLGHDAHHFGALERLAAVYSQTHEDHLLIETLNTLAEAAMHQGRSQVAVSALGQLLQLEPDEIHHRRRLRLLGLSDDEVQHLHAPALSAAQEAAQFAEPQPAPVAAPVEEASAGADDADVDARPAPSGFAAYDPDLQDAADGQEFPAEETAFDSAPHGYAAEFAPEVKAWDGAQTEGAEDAGQLNLGDEIESIEFYLAQGMLDVARYTLNALTERFPRHPEVAAARAQLEAAEAAAGGGTSAFDAGPSAGPEESDAAAPPATEEVSEPVKWFGHDAPGSLLEEEGQTIFLLPPQAPMVGVGQVMEGAAPVAEAIAVAPPSLSLDAAPGLDAARPFELLDGPEAGELLDLLDEFKAEAGQQTQVEDFDTHYNLGLAYKDMEMFDEAVEEFQQAFKGAMSDPAGQNYVLCCSMLGFCFTRKSLPRLAVMWFKRGLDSPGHTEDEYQALRFDLAQAYASLGETQQAHDLFSEVYGIDVNYRGVKARLQELEQQMAQA